VTAPACPAWADGVATLCGIGRIRPGPGTWGSLAALLTAWPLVQAAGAAGLVAGVVGATLLGTAAIRAHAAAGGPHDAGEIVIDEVAGQWLALLPVALLPQAGPLDWLAAFALFRAFDIAKPWPASYVDRSMTGAFAVVLDDLVAGAYAGGLILLGQRMLGAF